MKKLILIALLAFVGTANAQTEKGNWMFGGATTFNFNSSNPSAKQDGVTIDGIKTSNITATPSVGYFVMNNLAIGMDLELSVQKTKEYQSYGSPMIDVKTTVFGIIPSATYYFKNESKAFPYIGAGAGYAVAKAKVADTTIEPTNFFVWKIKGGVAYMITNDISVDFGLNYNQLSTKFNYPSGESYKSFNKNFGANLGFTLFLN
ncbi:OmpW family outer membrane protein [Paenimyroides viscosum]|jgi:outer membrane protein|uniref:Porin family protein n=1 Tax=Paenimyroides viscosum TaxID=2488729 RepID=A0A3P1ALQ3_9FLAO|nr:OmpW family outer membrane protein [Paenimyroides viscosum]RRA89886.1 porin family protein [Paenimyroides viscosum]